MVPIENGSAMIGRVSTYEVDTLRALHNGVSSSFDDSAAGDSSASDFSPRSNVRIENT
jgi:hypothetical protein